MSQDHIIAFLCLTTSPPPLLPKASYKDADGVERQVQLHEFEWDEWIRHNYRCPSIKVFLFDEIGNTLFVSYFCCQNDDSNVILENIFKTVYRMLPHITRIAYFLQDSLILFPPFSSQRPQAKTTEAIGTVKASRFSQSKTSIQFFAEYPAATHCTFPFSLQLCQREDFMAPLDIRLARVEDCDDLMPILRKHNILDEHHGDNYIAELLQSKSENTRALVAEVEGEIVGFMNVSREIDISVLRDTFQLEIFNYLTKVPSVTDVTNLSLSRVNMAAATEVTPEQLAVPNCFVVSMYCMDPNYAAFSMAFVRYAFQIWTDLEFAVITLAPGKAENQLMRECTPVPNIDPQYDHRLYVTNRYGIQEQIKIRKAIQTDLRAIKKLAVDLPGMDHFHDCVHSQFQDSSTFVSYVAVFANQIVGTMVLEQCNELSAQALTDQFDIESFFDIIWGPIVKKNCLVRYILMNPMFEHQLRYFSQEVTRRESINCLLYPRNTNALHDDATKRIVVREFVPVKPRRRIQFPDNMRDGIPVPDLIPNNLQILSVPLIYEPRMVVNSRLVVLGGSDVGVAFLESLVYTTHLHFSNLTLISRNGNPSVHDDAFVSSRNYSSSSILQLSMDYFVNIVEDNVVEIHRDQRLLTTAQHGIIPYDYLFLTPGQQYLYGKLGSILPFQMQNVLNMNLSELEKINAHLGSIVAQNASVCIYGRSLQAYQTVSYCLQRGLKGEQIHLVDPLTYSYLYDDPRLDQIMHSQLDNAKVQHYQGYHIESTRHEDARITMAKFKNSQADFLEISCALFLYADEKSVDPSTFEVLNNACLVFDNALVIDSKFRTNDKYIFGAGSITKYSVETHTDWRQMYCNSAEVGRQLAWLVLHLFDPTLDPKLYPKTLHQYRDAVKMAAKLPGGIKYFSFDIPKLPTWKLEANSKDLVLANESEYTRIRVNPRGYIESLVYLGPRDIPISNLECLYGHHEKYYNRLVSRFDEGVITDFVNFFNETWALALFHDRFDDLIVGLQEKAMQDTSIQDIVRSLSQLNEAVYFIHVGYRKGCRSCL
jgi:hypothetical protein